MCCARIVGIDLKSIAVPLNADPVRALRSHPELWESASEQPPFSRPWSDRPLPDISRSLLAVVPDDTGWVDHFDDRSFHQAEYLLDPAAYRTGAQTWEQREQSMAHRIIAGAEVFAEHATSGQGFRWRCSTTAFLTMAAEQIDTLDVIAARREFSVAEMDALGLYKVHREEDDDHAFARILTQLRAFGEHCRRTVARDLDLIITQY